MFPAARSSSDWAFQPGEPSSDAGAFLDQLMRSDAPMKRLPSAVAKVADGDPDVFPVFLANKIKPEAVQWPPVPGHGDGPTSFCTQALNDDDDLLWVDIDAAHFGTVREMLDYLASKRVAGAPGNVLVPAPRVVVHTSTYGFHVYWRAESVNRHVAEHARLYLSHVLRTDPAVAKGARAMRLPDGHVRGGGHRVTYSVLRRLDNGSCVKPVKASKVEWMAREWLNMSHKQDFTKDEVKTKVGMNQYVTDEVMLRRVVKTFEPCFPGTNTRSLYNSYVWSTFTACHEAGIDLQDAKQVLAAYFDERQNDATTTVSKLLRDWNPTATSAALYYKHVYRYCRRFIPDGVTVEGQGVVANKAWSYTKPESTRLTLEDLFGTEVADDLNAAIYGFSADPEVIAFLWLVAVSGSLQGRQTVLVDHDYVEHLNLYGAICGAPSSGKSPLLDALVYRPMTTTPDQPIYKSLEAVKLHYGNQPISEQNKLIYTTKLSLQRLVELQGPLGWPEPHVKLTKDDPRQRIPTTLIGTMGTSEGVARHLAVNGLPYDGKGGRRQSQPLTMICDELMGWLGNIGAYSTGAGKASSEAAALLGYYNGKGRGCPQRGA